MKIKICIFTGSRAEYGLLESLIEELKKEESVELQMLITGMHLSPEFGLTYKEINTEDISKIEKVEILLSSDTPVSICKAMGLGLISFSEALDRLKPDIFIGLGDRFELLSAVSACQVLGIPVAHIHGGEETIGAIDNAFRHSITKMSHLHFVSTEEYKKRIIQMGEDPKRVFNVGAIGLDNLKRLKLLSKDVLEKEIGFKIETPTILVTYHPETISNKSEKDFGEILKALDYFDNLKIIFTKPNADTYGRIIIKMIDDFVEKNLHRSCCFASLGQLKYLSCMKYVDGILGNSSSGIIEAPSFKIGTINIGDRQKGRVKANSIIDCKPIFSEIKKAIKIIISKEFKDSIKSIKNPYEPSDGKMASNKIKKILLKYNFKDLKKKFFDIKI